MQSSLNFGQAIEAVKTGKRISRSGWNGKEMFVFMRPSDALSYSFLPSVKSLPQSVKIYFSEKLGSIAAGQSAENEPKIQFTAYLCMKAADNTVVNGWLASQTDMLATDWFILDEKL